MKQEKEEIEGSDTVKRGEKEETLAGEERRKEKKQGMRGVFKAR